MNAYLVCPNYINGGYGVDPTAGTVIVAFCAETPNLLPSEDGEASRQTMDAHSTGNKFLGSMVILTCDGLPASSLSRYSELLTTKTG